MRGGIRSDSRFEFNVRFAVYALNPVADSETVAACDINIELDIMISFGEESLRFKRVIVNIVERNRSAGSRCLTSDLIRTCKVAVCYFFDRNCLRTDNEFVKEIVLFVGHFGIFHFAYRVTGVVSSVRQQISRGVISKVAEIRFLSVRRCVYGETHHRPAVGVSGKVVNNGIPLSRYEFRSVGKALPVRAVNVEKVVVAGVFPHQRCAEFVSGGGKVVHAIRSGIALERRRYINHERGAVDEVNIIRESLVSVIRNTLESAAYNGVIPIITLCAESIRVTTLEFAFEHFIERAAGVGRHKRARVIFYGIVVDGNFDSSCNGGFAVIVREKNHRFAYRFSGYGKTVESDKFLAFLDRRDNRRSLDLFGVYEHFRFYFVRRGIDVAFENRERNFILNGFYDIRFFNRNGNGFRGGRKSSIRRSHLNFRHSGSDAAHRSVLGDGNLIADGIVSIRNAFRYVGFLIRKSKMLFDVRRFSLIDGKRVHRKERSVAGVRYPDRVNHGDISHRRADLCQALFLTHSRNHAVFNGYYRFVRACPRGNSRNRLR